MADEQSDKAATAQAFATHAGIIAQFAVVALNSVILANSAAAGAVLLLIGSLWGKKEAAGVFGPAATSALIFASGMACGLAAAAFSYVAQSYYARADLHRLDWIEVVRLQRVGSRIHKAAVLATGASIIAFVVGAGIGLAALSKANGGLPTTEPLDRSLPYRAAPNG